MWPEQRSVTKTATVSLWGNVHEVDAHLVGQKVELVFDPFDLSRVRVRWRGKEIGEGLPRTIRRHSHPRPVPSRLPRPLPPGSTISGWSSSPGWRAETADLL